MTISVLDSNGSPQTIKTNDDIVAAAGTPSANVLSVQGVTSMTALKVDLSGTGANTTAVKVDGSGVTQPVSGSVSISGTPAVTVSSGQIQLVGTSAVSATSLPLPTGAATAANQTSVQGSAAGGTAATSSQLVGGVYNSAAPTLTTGQQASAQLDASGNLKVNIAAGAAAGGTSSSFAAAFPSTGTAIGAKNGLNMVNLTADASNNLNVNVAAGSVAQSGTWTVQPGNTANTTPWLYSLSNTGGSAQAQVVANSDALANQVGVSANAQNQVYNGTNWDRAREATADAMAATGLQAVGNMLFNGTTWDRLQGDSSKNLKVTLNTGTTNATVKAGSTGAAAATDTALVVTVRDANANGQTTLTGGAPVSIASDQTIINKAVTQSSGTTDSRVNSAATTNATSLKASAGNMFSIDVYNEASYDVFLKLYDKASAPTVGTDTPVWTIPVATKTGFSRDFPRGRHFSTGIAYAITKLQADSDTTAVAANDLTGTIGWI